MLWIITIRIIVKIGENSCLFNVGMENILNDKHKLCFEDSIVNLTKKSPLFLGMRPVKGVPPLGASQRYAPMQCQIKFSIYVIH